MSYYIVKVKGNKEEFIINGRSKEDSLAMFNEVYCNVEYVE